MSSGKTAHSFLPAGRKPDDKDAGVPVEGPPKAIAASGVDGMGRVSLQRVGEVWYLLHNGPDMINSQLKSGKPWEPMTAQLAILMLQRADRPVVLDVGANLGAFSVPVGRWLAERAGRLIAFEPQRMVYYQLCGNFFANGLSHCEARMEALGAEQGSVSVPVLDVHAHANLGGLSLDEEIRRYPRRHAVDDSRTEDVRMTSISALGLARIDLIKIDVEGLELEVLQGARSWMTSHGYPPLLFEVWGDYLPQYRPKREALMRLVSDEMGYEVTMLGELCLAQHPTRTVLTIRRNADKTITFAPLA